MGELDKYKKEVCFVVILLWWVFYNFFCVGFFTIVVNIIYFFIGWRIYYRLNNKYFIG